MTNLGEVHSTNNNCCKNKTRIYVNSGFPDVIDPQLKNTKTNRKKTVHISASVINIYYLG